MNYRKPPVRWAGVGFVAPFVVLFLAFLVLPIVYAFYLSLFQDTLVGGTRFIGAKNYLKVLRDDRFWSGVKITLTYGFVLVPVLLCASLLVALVLDSRYIWGRTLFRVGLFLPYAVPGVIAALLWGYLYGPAFGPITQLARAMGVPPPPLLSDGWMIFSIANIGFWELLGYKMIIVYSAMKAIPTDLEEAAVIDGSKPWQFALYVKVPLVASAILLNAIFAVIGTLQLFNQPAVLKSIAPSVITDHYTPNMYARSLAFVGQQYNYAGAVSFLLGAIVAVISFTIMYFVRRRRLQRM